MQREDGSFAARLAETSRGASLLEVLAATAMLSIVIGVVLATLVSLTGNQQRQERMVARQETVRLALDQVSRDLRGATSIAIFSNVGDYAQQIEAEVWKADETRQWVRWSLNGNHLQRHILTGPGGQTLSFATVATGLSAGDGGEPLLRYYDKHADELTSAQPAADFATCAVRVRVSIAVAASEGAPAFGANTAVELRNRQDAASC